MLLKSTQSVLPHQVNEKEKDPYLTDLFDNRLKQASYGIIYN